MITTTKMDGMLRIVWDQNKDRINRRKHRVSFAEAAEVSFDPFGDTVNDHRHPAEELRLFTVGRIFSGRMLSVAHAEDGVAIRICYRQSFKRLREETI